MWVGVKYLNWSSIFVGGGGWVWVYLKIPIAIVQKTLNSKFKCSLSIASLPFLFIKLAAESYKWFITFAQIIFINRLFIAFKWTRRHFWINFSCGNSIFNLFRLISSRRFVLQFNLSPRLFDIICQDNAEQNEFKFICWISLKLQIRDFETETSHNTGFYDGRKTKPYTNPI